MAKIVWPQACPEGKDTDQGDVDSGLPGDLVEVREVLRRAVRRVCPRFLEAQQEKLFEHIRRQKAQAAERDSTREAVAATRPQPTYLATGERTGMLAPNTTGTYVLLFHIDGRPVIKRVVRR